MQIPTTLQHQGPLTKCLTCNKDFPLNQMRSHMYKCPRYIWLCILITVKSVNMVSWFEFVRLSDKDINKHSHLSVAQKRICETTYVCTGKCVIDKGTVRSLEKMHFRISV